MKKKKTAAALMIALLCVTFAAEGVLAAERGDLPGRISAPARLQTYVPGYGDVDIDDLNLSDEEIEQYQQQIDGIDFSDPEAADAQIKQMAESAGYSISDSEAETIRGMLDDGSGGSANAEEMKGMYEAYKGLGEDVQNSENLLDTLLTFLKNLVSAIKSWFMNLFHMN